MRNNSKSGPSARGLRNSHEIRKPHELRTPQRPWFLRPALQPRQGRRITVQALVTALCAIVVSSCAGNSSSPYSPPLTITSHGGSRPSTAIDPRDGTVYVAWVGTETGSADVFLSRLDPGAERSTTPVRVNDIPGDAAPHDQAPARVAVGPDGNVYLAWQNNRQIPGRRFPASNLRFTRSNDRGATFEPARTVNQHTDGHPASNTFHDLAITADGQLLVSWIQSGESGGYAAGHTTDHASNHTTNHASGSEVHLARSTDGGYTFPTSQVVDRGACPCCRTTIAIAPDGTAFLAWRKILQENIRDIVVARAEPLPEHGTTSGLIHPPTRPHHDDWRLDACPHAGPALLVDRSGTLHLAWYTGRKGGGGLYYSASTDHGVTYAPPTPVLAGNTIPPSQIALAASGNGTILIAWEDRRSAERRIHLAQIEHRARLGTLGISNGTPTKITSELLTLNGATPALAAAAGTTALAWLDGEAVRLIVAR